MVVLGVLGALVVGLKGRRDRRDGRTQRTPFPTHSVNSVSSVAESSVVMLDPYPRSSLYIAYRMFLSKRFESSLTGSFS